MSKQTITEFLEARIAEDEKTATALLRDLDGEVAESYAGVVDERGPMTPDRLLHAQMWAHYDGQSKRRSFAKGQQIADLASPARVLAECAAKRAIIRLHRPAVEIVEWFDDATGTGTAPVCPSCRPKDPTDWNPPMGMAGVRPDGFVPSYTLAPCPTLRSLAAVYADHPDYDAEWSVA